MTSSVDPIRFPQRAASDDTEIDRAALANLLVEIARNVDPDHHARFDGVPTADRRMETLRQLLVGREISELSRVTHLLGEPEQLAEAVGGILPSAAARAPHMQLGEALTPAVETAVQRSIKKSPRTLTDILYPVFLPAIRKSIGEKIDQTFQSLNETLRHIFTWHGLKWRFESWRTGASFSEVVLKHSLVYRVEHVFLIDRNSGLLIAHVTAENATSEDPQLISSMLSAIQDFVKDSFNEKEQSGLDTIRFGELRLWSEVGQFATLVSVIRGNPPEELHEIVSDVLLRIHNEYSQALEQFDGDGSQLAGIETQLQTCVELKQEDSNQGFPWLVVAAVLLVLIPAGGWFFLSWQSGQRWQAYVSRLGTQPGIIVAQQTARGGQFYISGLRDPLGADPQSLLSGTHVDPARVHSQWQFYQSLEPSFVLMRLTASLAPPDTVRLSIVQGRIVAEGEAPDTWIDRARAAARQLSAGGPEFDISKVRDVSPETRAAERWQAYVSRLEVQPGIIVAQQTARGGQFYISGLRDPLSADPQSLLSGTHVDPARVHSQWQFYQSLEPAFVLKRLTASLAPPDTVRLSIVRDRIVAEGEAPDTWIDRARAAARQLSAGGPEFDISKVRDVSPETRAAEHWQAYMSRLRAQPGIIVAEQKVRDGQFYISGLRDPLGADPQSLLSGTQVDPARVHSQWQFYQSLEPAFVLKRLTASLAPPDTVRLSIVRGRIVAEGEAPDTWIDRARAAARQLSAGGPEFDISKVRDVSPETRAAEHWQAYVSRLEVQPGIIVAQQTARGGQFYISGLRDPLSADPQSLLSGTHVDPARVHSQWQFYQSLEPAFVLKRLTASLAPPKSVLLSIVKDRIVAEGEAPDTWIDRARAVARQLSVGGPEFAISKVRDVSPEARAAEHWQAYVSRLGTQPGIIVAQQTARGGQFYISGLRDPLGADPQSLLSGTHVDPARVHSQWQFYQSLEPAFVLMRLTASLAPPDTVRLSIVQGRIVAEGEAPDTWIDRARAAARQLSAGGPEFDISKVRDVSPETRAAEHWQAYVSRLKTQPGIIVAEQKARDGQFYISGLRDPLSADPQSLLSGTHVDPARVHSQWQFYQSLEPAFVLKRLTASLAPPKSVLLSIAQGRIVAEGEAPANWINRAQAAAEQLSADGVVLDVSQLHELNLAELNYLREAIQATDIFFYSGKAVPGPEQTPVLDRLADQIKEFAQNARKSGVTARFMLTGHADATGRETANVSISAARAETVRALLNKRGVAPELLLVRGAGTFEPVVPENSQTGSSTNRRVSITISLE